MSASTVNTALLPRLRRFVFIAICGLGVILPAGCTGKDEGREAKDAEPDTASQTEVSRGWDEFDYGSVRGAAPESWSTLVMESTDFMDLVRTGLKETDLSAKAKSSFEKLGPDEVSDKVLVAVADTAEGFPNINVQLCFPGAKPISAKDGEAAASALAEALGVQVTMVGELNLGHGSVSIFKAELFPDLDSYQTVVGDGDCGSIATLTTEPGDRAAFDDFETFLQLLEVETD